MSSGTTVILGAGIIGVSTALYLSEHQPGTTVHLVEPCPELFASASGYAGGFLARDWFSPATAALGALSFDEHRALAARDDGPRNWGYVRSAAVSLSRAGDKDGEEVKGDGVDVWCRDGESRAVAAAASGGDAVAAAAGAATTPPWLRSGQGDAVEVISEEGTVAQIDPLQLCQHLLQKCLAAGVHLHHPARAVAVHVDAIHGELSGVRIAAGTGSGSGAITETDVPCTRLLIAAGAWSPQVCAALFPGSTIAALPVSSLAGHSIVVRSPRWTGTGNGAEKKKEKGNAIEEGAVSRDGDGDEGCCHAVFTTAPDVPDYAPELFSRPNGHIFVGGLNSATEPLPPLPTDARAGIRRDAIEQLRETARLLINGDRPASSDGDDDLLEVVREGLCFRPATARGTPILDRVPDAWLGSGSEIKTRPGADGGVYVAAGHGPWGISQSLGTGRVMAEMMQGRGMSADVSALGFGGLL
ncbi:hypothetical protein SLS62_006942 [Diatrype stigma]|uniref:FAD dependent oxidoreductase domain-containing protein n=1 Tax=Diatrype stigma TaxID=117547 RepID=A0AAN9YMI5_9PEZI